MERRECIDDESSWNNSNLATFQPRFPWNSQGLPFQKAIKIACFPSPTVMCHYGKSKYARKTKIMLQQFHVHIRRKASFKTSKKRVGCFNNGEIFFGVIRSWKPPASMSDIWQAFPHHRNSSRASTPFAPWEPRPSAADCTKSLQSSKTSSWRMAKDMEQYDPLETNCSHWWFECWDGCVTA